MSSPPTTAPPKLKQGDARWFFGNLAVIRATAEDTGGKYTLVDVTAPAGLESPLHVHHVEDEGFLVLEGSVMVEVDGERHDLSAGQFALGPIDVPHRYVVGPEGCRMLWVLTPSGFEDLVAAASIEAPTMTPPPADLAPPANAAEIVASFGNELLAY